MPLINLDAVLRFLRNEVNAPEQVRLIEQYLRDNHLVRIL
jgi:hypothetical protein